MKVYYVKDNFDYSIEYYYDGIKDETKTETGAAEFGSIINTYTDKNITGYKLEKEPEALTISEESVENVMRIYYVKDSFEYRVEYYYNGELDEENTETGTAEFGSIINKYIDKKIIGYKLDKVENNPLEIAKK